ncbi:MAG: serine hydrolase [Actinomycetota bacterium]
MTTLASKISDVQAALETLARQHKVPGASLGILHGSELVEFVTGVANRNTGVPVTTNTLFQIGSNTKVYTATLVMQLVDEGLVDLDAPVKKYLPKLKLADGKALEVITVRHLMTHTSGIEGDYFDDFGRGDDGIEKFVGSLKDIGQIYQPGVMWSYCNTGWTLLGHLVEKLRGEPYHKVLRDKLLTPIGASATTVLMEEMLARSCAVGHIALPGAEPFVPPMVIMSPSHAPAGSMTSSTPAEVLRFVRMHLNGGRAKDTTRILSAGSVKAMQQPQAKLPESSLGTAMGLGWILSEWDGERVIGHGGGTIGQVSFLQILPDRPFGVCLLTNSTSGGALWRELSRYLYHEFADVRPPEVPSAPEVPPTLDLSKYTGAYTRLGIDIDVSVENEQLVGEMKSTGALASLAGPPQKIAARPIDKEIFLANLSGEDTIVQFLDFDRSGRPRYMHVGGRVSRRVQDGASAPPSNRRSKSQPKRGSAKKSRPKRSTARKKAKPARRKAAGRRRKR